MKESLSPNTTLSHYLVLSRLGAGGMGGVYRARDTKLGRDVAIKVLAAAFSADTERLRRFEQEAQAAGALNHPNILVIFHIGTHDGAPYIVSELLVSLQSRRSERRRQYDRAKQLRRLRLLPPLQTLIASAKRPGSCSRFIRPRFCMFRDGRLGTDTEVARDLSVGWCVSVLRHL